MATNKIANRVDTKANWTSNNPTLLAGEKGYESDTRSYKIGDGSTAWTSLEYFEGNETLTITSSTYTIASTGISTLEVNAGTSTITLPDLATWAGRKIIIRKISGTAGTITIQRAGSDIITRSSLANVTLTSEGDFYEITAATNNWELTAGQETGDYFERKADGVQHCWELDTATKIASTAVGNIFYNSVAKVFTFPKAFADTTSLVVNTTATLVGGLVWATAPSAKTVSQVTTSLLAHSITSSGKLGYYATGRWYL